MADENQKMALSPEHPLSGERVLRIPPSPTIENQGSKVKLQVYDKTVRIATWNVRSLFQSGKLANTEAEMCRMKIDILGLSEVRWPGSGKQKTKGGYIYYSGGTDPKHQYGTAIMVSNRIAQSVIDFIPLNDRTAFWKLRTTHRDMNIVQVYAPTNDKSDQETEEFYSAIDEILRLTKRGEITMVIGDFNAKIGCGAEGDNVGSYGLGTRNDRGNRLAQFCVENDLLIANTFFKQHPRRLYTWKSPAEKDGRIIRNQIDFILVGLNFKKNIKSVKTYPGADIHSDHNPVVMDFKMKRFLRVERRVTSRIDTKQRKNPEKRQEISLVIEKELGNTTNPISVDNVEKTWNTIKEKIVKIQEVNIGFTKNNKKQEWITEEIIDLMVERRINKTNPTEYKKYNKIIRRKCREAKEKWMSAKCQEIEQLQERYDHFNVHKKIKEMTGKRRKRQETNLRGDNELIVGTEEKLVRWKEYIQKLFDDDRPNASPSINKEINEKGPIISKQEVIHAIKAQKEGKATGLDKINAEVLKLIAENEGKTLDLLTALFNEIYNSGKIPSDWLRSTFVPLPKKPNSTHCDDYRIISLMSHVLKTFLRVIHARIYKKCEYQMDNTQFGFRNGMGTREALFSLNVLAQRCRDMNVDVYACFIDYRKAFDCVSHEKMMQILRETGIDEQDLHVVSELYWHQTATVEIDQMTSEDIQIRRGVRQGCVLSLGVYIQRSTGRS
ncbi:uncharacterized protein LOC123310952 [Coccinella septempunctata]|uniref:uncharacterized protein LOC123310952 n=1 Tax=Coccinella septempunctata TaxID=41139 RepID=UPI001D088E1F|nr:uncharacterized protein LOC123310952 [Coccinella septempunctata]